MGNPLVKQGSWMPVRKIRMAFYAVLLALALLGLAVVARLAGIDITHLVVGALASLVPLSVGYMTHAERESDV